MNQYPHPELDDPGGEMLPLERAKLQEWVYKKAPSTVIEIGGGAGGGSTMQICNAIARLDGQTKLITTDPLHAWNAYAGQYYGSHPVFKDFIEIHGLQGGDLIKFHIKSPPEFVFFDGPDNPQVVYDDFLAIEKLMPVGSWFASHDWEVGKRAYDGAVCPKNETLRPYLEANPNWKIVEQLDGLASTDSVGLILMEKV